MSEEKIKRISFSELKTWKECPYRHKLIYLDKEPYFEGNEYTAFGTSMHKVCESILPGDSQDPVNIFDTSFAHELEQINSDTNIDKSLVEEMKKQAKTLCLVIESEIKKYFGNFKVFSIEEEILQPINEFNSYEKSFKGFIDAVIKTEDGKYHIIDWKTCSWGWPSQKKTSPMTTYQLTYYKNYFAKKHNIDIKNIETYFVLLKRTAKKDNVEVIRVTSGLKKTQNSLKVLENAVINIERKNYIKNRLNCKYCKFYKTEKCT